MDRESQRIKERTMRTREKMMISPVGQALISQKLMKSQSHKPQVHHLQLLSQHLQVRAHQIHQQLQAQLLRFQVTQQLQQVLQPHHLQIQAVHLKLVFLPPQLHHHHPHRVLFRQFLQLLVQQAPQSQPYPAHRRQVRQQQQFQAVYPQLPQLQPHHQTKPIEYEMILHLLVFFYSHSFFQR